MITPAGRASISSRNWLTFATTLLSVDIVVREGSSINKIIMSYLLFTSTLLWIKYYIIDIFYTWI